jgi:hypothetical protein
MALDLHFQPNASGGGTSSSDFTKDAFEDISLAASNNTGFSSTVSKNPLSQYFANDDAPKIENKNLFIKDLILLDDKNLWVNNKPTYQIIFTENFPGVFAYAYGNIRLRQSIGGQGKMIEIRNPNDGIGVTGVIQNIMWRLNPSSQSAATATRILDGATGSTIDFSSTPATVEYLGENKQNLYLHSASNNDRNLHDYRLEAVQQYTLKVSGFSVFFGQQVDAFPGVTYLDKTKVTTTTGQSFGFDGATFTGGRAVVCKTASATYGVTTSLGDLVSSVATGTINTNLITVTTGQGGSFLAGMGIVSFFGTSAYVGQVASVSTDTLTVGPTLVSGVSGPIYKAWQAGSTYAISATLFTKAYSFDPAVANNPIQGNGFGVTTTGDFAWSHPEKKYRVWGDQLLFTSVDGYPALAFNGSTVGFVQVDGDFQAADLTWIGVGSSSVLHGTFAINGVNSWGQNQGFTAILKQTIFKDAVQGWNSFRFDVGASFFNVGIAKIDFYKKAAPVGPTLGRLAEFDIFGTSAMRFSDAVNASLMVVGTKQRLYGDDLYFKGDWARGATHSAVGGIAFAGASTNSTLNFNFYGTGFALMGTAGGSGVLTFDGASTTSTFNKAIMGTTNTFHTVTYNYQAGATAIVQAVDVYGPRGEADNKQNSLAVPEVANIPQTFIQGDTPRKAKDGDIWVQRKSTAFNVVPAVWIRVADTWLQVGVQQVSDDPNLTTFVRSHGSSTGVAAGGVQDVELFNLFAWNTGISSTLGARVYGNFANAAFNNLHLVIDGANTSNVATLGNQQFNKFAWISATNRSTAKGVSSGGQFNGVFYVNKGLTDTSTLASGQAVAEKWNSSSWATATAWGTAASSCGAFTQGNLLYVMGGTNAGGSTITTNESRTVADSVSTGAALPITSAATASSASSGGNGLCSAISSTGSPSLVAYSFNGSAWSSALSGSYATVADQTSGQAFLPNRNATVRNGGNFANDSSPQNNTETYNGVAFSSLSISTTSRGRSSSSAI